MLALLAAAAFLACPLLIMHASIQVSGKASGHGGLNVMDGLLLIIGPVCFVWVLAGVAAVGAAGWMLLVVSVESLVRGISRLPARGITITVISGGVAFLLLNVVSVPLSGNESTRKAPAGTELAHLEEVVKQEKDADESVDNKLDMEEAAVELEPGQWFKPCRFGTPVAADPSGKVYTCDTNGVSSTLEYFAEPNEVQGALLGRAWEVGAVRPKATCPDHAPALQEYELGYLLCFVKHRHLYYAWTNSTEYEVRYTEARFLSANPRAAQQWWKQASKVVSAHWVGS
ncbi:MAG TPA: hypothetical protein VFI09_03565 [Solirubrobacterales bacterium]|nr:hypothetical protein [Solirubrobacterales bacterium]